MTYPYQFKLSKSTFITVLFLILAGLTALFYAQSQAQAAVPDVWIDYTIHENDVIEVKLFDGLPLRAENGRLHNTDSQNQKQINPLLAELPAGNWQPVFDVPEATLNSWRETGMNRSGEKLPDLNLFFHVQLPEEMDAAAALPLFRQSPLVEGAYPVAKAAPPPLPPDYETSNDSNFDAALNLNIYQRYLDAAPDGMDVRYAWEGTGGRGSGIAICDVEYGFNYHNDLPPITLLAVPTKAYTNDYYEHGTAVLGMLGAKNNGWGATGMVTEAQFFFSPVHSTTGSFDIDNAITRCINKLDTGDVILLEQQTGGQNGNYVPVEWDPSVYAAIKTAVASGIIVVEAAGNGNEDLDHTFYQTAQPGHAPFTAANDSGAIIVGSAKSPWTPAPRAWNDGSSTYGSTVDLQGWGMHVLTTGYGNYYNDDGDQLTYTLFSGTSSASPMVTAAATIAQANYVAKNSSPATPATVKQLLINTGTAQADEGTEHIGPQPNLRAAINSIWGLPNPAAPTITPVSGTYNMPLQVTLDYGDAAQNSSNTHLRYTLDGSEPTPDSYIFIPEFNDSITLLYGAMVKAKAFSSSAAAGRLLESDSATAVYQSSTPKVATPVISPDGGTFNQGTSIVINTSTPGATIRYRTDGRAPSFFYPGTEYTGPITLPPGTYEIAARGYKDGYYKSDTAYSDEITINALTLPAPTIYPNGGSFAGEVTVYLGTNVLGAQIRYTTDGATPTESSPLFDEPFALTSSATVKARIYLAGYAPSSVTTAVFTVIPQAAPPTFSPPSGSTANDSLPVTLSTTTPGATIRYTTNGAEPTSYSTAYSGPFNLSAGQHTLKAKSFLSGATPSTTATATYTVFDTTVNIDPPAIDPPNGNFNGPITMTLSSDTEDVFLFYTLDGTDPATSPSVQPYNGPVQLTGDATYFVRARAFLSGVGNSNMSSATLVVVNPTLGQVQAPTIAPPGGQYTNTVSVSVEAPDFSTPFNIRRLYVTTNGVDPVADFSTAGNGSGGVYNFSVSAPQTVKAIAAQAGWFDSDVTTAEYTFICDTPSITAGGTFTDSVNVSISTGTIGSTIYYTTDGSEPTTSSSQYSSPFNLADDAIVKAMCVRNNYEQSETAVSVFVVNPTPTPPSITSQPQSQAADVCSSATFSVAANGSDSLSYEWRKDGTIIGAADEPELTLAAILPGDAGSYSVIVGNAAGEVTSSTAVLTVNGSATTCADTDSFSVYLPTIIR